MQTDPRVHRDGRLHRDYRMLAVATASAFCAAMLAISEHAAGIEAGYELGAARREGAVLRREAENADRRVAMLRLPTAVAMRAEAVHKLGLQHPRDRRVLSPEQVAALVAPPVPQSGSVPTGVMAK